MKKLNSRNSLIYFFYLFLGIPILIASIFGAQCNNDDVISYSCLDKGNVLQLACPALPNTNLTAQPDFDVFAWNSFVALNWPALVDPDNLQRGIPDLNQSFIDADPNAVLVWETLKEKREVFNVPQSNTTILPPWNNIPVYDADGLRPGSNPSFVPGTMTGIPASPPNIIFNTLDETIEVKSESIEGNPSTNPAYSHIVSPRVWRGQPSDGNPVLYEVKVNYDFYKYVGDNKYFLDQTATNAAQDTSTTPNPGIRLPFRTSAMHPAPDTSDTNQPIPNKNNVNRVVNYLSQNALKQYIAANNNPNPATPPPLAGAVHVKAAWIELNENDDLTKYHTTTAEYYTTGANGIQKNYGIFGLVGLHIIQRVHLGNPGNPNAQQRGGTFIFATWEHLSVETGYSYSNYRSNQGVQSNLGWYPHEDQPIINAGFDTIFLNPKTYPVKRRFPILAGTQAVNRAVWNTLPPSSVWQNYQLIGTQFQGVDCLPESDSLATNYNDPSSIGQPQFLSNLVIETNAGLQHFRGQPPLTTTVKNFNSQGVLSNNANGFVRTNKNLLSGGQAYNMGGCMGCHGVAQSEGYSFSFVLLGGHEGATTDTDSLFDLPPPLISDRKPN